MADFEQGYNHTSIGAAASTLIVGRHATLNTLNILGTGNGTLAIYDVSTAAGTTGANVKLTIPFLSVVAPATLPLNVSFKDGIVATVTGTINAGIGWT